MYIFFLCFLRRVWTFGKGWSIFPFLHLQVFPLLFVKCIPLSSHSFFFSFSYSLPKVDSLMFFFFFLLRSYFWLHPQILLSQLATSDTFPLLLELTVVGTALLLSSIEYVMKLWECILSFNPCYHLLAVSLFR